MILSTTITLSQTLEKIDYRILVFIPAANTDDTATAAQSWQRSEEILSGAEQALQSLNHLCFPFTVSITPLRIDCSSSELSLVQLVRELTAENKSIVAAVVGLFCRSSVNEFVGISTQERLGLVQIALNGFLPMRSLKEQNSTQHFHQIFPSSLVYAEALAQFMEHAGWSRIAVTYYAVHEYYLKMLEQVVMTLKYKGFEDISTIRIDEIDLYKNKLKQTLKSIQVLGIKIVYILLPPMEATLLLCYAYEDGLQWPEYGWIVPDVSLENLTSTTYCNPMSLQHIISFRLTTNTTGAISSDNACSEQSPDISNSILTSNNIYAMALYDSIHAIAFSINDTFYEIQEEYLGTQPRESHTQQYFNLIIQKRVSQMIGQALVKQSFSGLLGDITFSKEHKTQILIRVSQNIGHNSPQQLAVYNPHENTTHIESDNITYPSDELKRVYRVLPLALEVILMIGIAACALLITINIILYIYYRKSSEIKASSVGISMTIYISCYVICIGAAIDVRNSTYIIDYKVACTDIIWAIYLWGDIILATLLVKVGRIYHIFSHFGKIRKVSTEKHLLALITVIVLGKLIILTIWTVVDPYRIITVEIYHSEAIPPYYEVLQHCYSHHFLIWISVTLGYSATLAVFLAIASYKTRKIRRKDFKNTKKINILLSLILMFIAIVVPMWWVYRGAGNTVMSRILIVSLYLFIPTCCQLCLFSPKILPPLRRSLKKHFFKQNGRFEKLKLHKQLDKTELSSTLSTQSTAISLI